MIKVYFYHKQFGEFHCGVQVDRDVAYLRLASDRTQLLAWLEVTLNDSAPRTVEALNAVIDEGFRRIDLPLREAQQYSKETPQGKLEILYRAPYFKDAAEAKAVIAKVLQLVVESPFTQTKTV